MTDEIESGQENWQARAERAEAALLSAQTEIGARLIRAELKAEAIRAGMVDLDGLKLLDTAEVKLNDNGEVADGAAILGGLKRAKPWLFGNASSSSAGATPPRPEPPRTRHANELTREEWQIARAALVRRK